MAKKFESFYSPKGTLVYPHLTAPDTQFNPDGVYATKLRVPADEAEDIIALIDERMEAALEKAREEVNNSGKKGAALKKALDAITPANPPYEEELEDDSGEPTGYVLIKFKVNAKTTYQHGPKAGKTVSNCPKLFDAKVRPLDPDEIEIGGGSEAVVNYYFYTFYTATAGAGVTLRPKAVQILDLKEPGSSSGFGFVAQEGFEREDREQPPPHTDADIPDANDPDF